MGKHRKKNRSSSNGSKGTKTRQISKSETPKQPDTKNTSADSRQNQGSVDESRTASILRHPFTIGLAIIGAIALAFQSAGVPSMLLAKIVLACGVWMFITAEVYFSKWIKKTGRYAGSVVLMVCCLSGIGTIDLCKVIAQMKQQQPSDLSTGVNEPCKINATVDTVVVTRLHSRGIIPTPAGRTIYTSPMFQELFYDWVLTISPNRDAGAIFVVLKDRRKSNYRLRIEPTETAQSEPTPGWATGFNEPREPDYYKRVIRWEHLDKLATITIRRPIKLKRGGTRFDASSFPAGEYEINSNIPCSITKSDIYEDANDRFLHLMPFVKILANSKYRDGRPLVTLADPDVPLPPPKPGEFETTLEFRPNDTHK